MKIERHEWKIKDKFKGKLHLGTRERKRRIKQIESGALKSDNGVKV
jgi:hypothetical protein